MALLVPEEVVRCQHLSQIKARLLCLAENVISPIKTRQATSGTSAAAYKLMDPQKKLEIMKPVQ